MPSSVPYLVSLRLLMREEQQSADLTAGSADFSVVAIPLFIYIVLRNMCGSVVQGTGCCLPLCMILLKPIQQFLAIRIFH
jgi:hypothetical protein